MLNVVTRILKAVLPTLIFSQQTAYVKNKFIGESGRLVSDMNIEKTFDSLDHDSISSVLRKFGFSKSFIT